MPTSKIILGLVAPMAGGKTTVTNYLNEKYGAMSFRFSDMLRDVLNRLHLEHSRHNLQNISTLLRQEFGDDLMSKVIALDVCESNKKFIITEGVRRPSDVEYLKKIPGFHLVSIETYELVRYERIIKRTENPDDQNKTWEQFQADGLQESEQKIKEIAALADDVINNNGNLEELYAQIDGIIAKYKN